MKKWWAIGVLTVSLSAALVSVPSWSVGHSPSIAVSSHELSDEIGKRITRVPEFAFIRQEAKSLGIRAWLFGGTAAGYAHYVKRDLQRENGDKSFQAARFDYDYSNIYRSTQDLDIVVDGPPEKAQALQEHLAKRYPHLQGSKTAWEVRLLRQNMGDKQTLLHNPDFLNQHTDSNSTGMVEITVPSQGEPIVRDLRDWSSRDPFFLRDVREGKLHYYFSPKHAETSFYKEGRNPPIVSVIRYLTKAFQYGLKLRDEDLAQVKKIIDAFDPHGNEMQNSYVRNWLLKKENGRKLIKNAVDVEYAWNTLEKLGLRKKLIEIENNPTEFDSLAWWMNKEPLRTFEIGRGDGKTAAQLGLTIVTHNTDSFPAYESIQFSPQGVVNALISRGANGEISGEAAIHGDGFYTLEGREGLGEKGSFGIRMKVNPKAREKTDFKIIPNDSGPNIVLFHNKAAIEVIPESLNIGPVEFFEILSTKDLGNGSDRGIFEMLKRRVNQKVNALSQTDLQKIHKIVSAEVMKPNPRWPLLEQWFSIPASHLYHDTIDKLVETNQFDREIIRNVLSQPHWKDYPELVKKFLDQWGYHHDIINFVLTQPHWKDHPEFVEQFLEQGNYGHSLAENVLSQPHWKEHPKLVERLIEQRHHYAIAQHVLSQPHWKDHPELVRKLIERTSYHDLSEIAYFVLIKPHWKEHPELVKQLIEKKMKEKYPSKHQDDYLNDQFQKMLNQPHWKNNSELRALSQTVSLPEIQEAIRRENSVKASTPFSECIRGALNHQLTP